MGEDVRGLPCQTFADAFDAVRRGRARYALVPAENSTAGTVHEVFDLLVRRRLAIVGEHLLRVEHCLLVSKSARKAPVTRVYSHPQALAQCERLICRLGAEPRAVYDTAGGARLVSRKRAPGSAAIASLLAARLYGLRVLKRRIQDQPDNITRFLLLARPEDPPPPPIAPPPAATRKTSLLFETRHRPGSLARALAAFADRDINLTKIESRPIPNRPFEYLFYVDILSTGSTRDLDTALASLRRAALVVHVLGSYAPAPNLQPLRHRRSCPTPMTPLSTRR